MATPETCTKDILNLPQNESTVEPASTFSDNSTYVVKNGVVSADLRSTIKSLPNSAQCAVPGKTDSVRISNITRDSASGNGANSSGLKVSRIPGVPNGQMSQIPVCAATASSNANANINGRSAMMTDSRGNVFQTPMNSSSMLNVYNMQNAKNGVHLSVPVGTASSFAPQTQNTEALTPRQSPVRETRGPTPNSMTPNSMPNSVYRLPHNAMVLQPGMQQFQVSMMPPSSHMTVQQQQHVQSGNQALRPNVSYVSFGGSAPGMPVAQPGMPAVTSMVTVNTTRPSVPQTLLVGQPMTGVQSQQLQLVNIQPGSSVMQPISAVQRQMMPRTLVPMPRQPDQGLQRSAATLQIAQPSYRLLPNGQVMMMSASVPQQAAAARMVQPAMAAASPQRLAVNIASADMRARTIVPGGIQLQPARAGSASRQMLLLPAGSNPVTAAAMQQRPAVFPNFSQMATMVDSQGQTRPFAVASSSEAILSNPAILENVKKCRSFLSTLLKLAAGQQPETLVKVSKLVQDLIDGAIEEEAFTNRLEVELKSEPQPTLVTFLKKNLPYVRQLMLEGKLQIEGLRVPNRPLGGQVTQMAAIGTPTVPLAFRQGGQSMTATAPSIKQSSDTPEPASTPPTKAPRPSKSSKKTAADKAAAAGGLKALANSKLPSALKDLTKSSSAPAAKEKRKYEPSTLKEDDGDINDVAEMGGVNLNEESKNILATSSLLAAAQLRSCKEETLLGGSLFMDRLRATAKRHGVEEVEGSVATVLSHAVEERLSTVLHRLRCLASRRTTAANNNNIVASGSGVGCGKRSRQVALLNTILSSKRLCLQEDSDVDSDVEMRDDNHTGCDEPMSNSQPLAERQLPSAHSQDGTTIDRWSATPVSDKQQVTGVASLTSPPPSSLLSNIERRSCIAVKDVVFLLESDTDLKHSPLLYRALLKQ